MKPKPFSLLNHFTVPSGTAPPNCNARPTSGARGLLRTTAQAYRNGAPSASGWPIDPRPVEAAASAGPTPALGHGSEAARLRRCGRRRERGRRRLLAAPAAVAEPAAQLVARVVEGVPSSCIASPAAVGDDQPRRSAPARCRTRRSTNSFGPGWKTIRSSTITTAAMPSAGGDRAGRDRQRDGARGGRQHRQRRSPTSAAARITRLAIVAEEALAVPGA